MFSHNINPVIVSIGPFTIYWYGLMYVLSFIFIYFMLLFLVKRKKIKLKGKDIDEFMIYSVIGMLVGARLFEIIIYNPGYYLANPFDIIAIWKGGLSFHGGLLGILTATYYFCKKKKFPLLRMADLFVIPAGIALMLGRIGNFINGELYGTVTDVSWCFKFQGAEGCRHPSQLYEAGKNLLIFIVMWTIKDKKKPDGFFFALFLILYGTLRFFIEFVRQSTVMVGPITMGQFLSALMVVGGILLLKWISKEKHL